MASNRQQGTYLGTTLAGFTAFPAGLAMGGAKGVLIAIVGLVLLAISAFGLHREKSATSSN